MKFLIIFLFITKAWAQDHKQLSDHLHQVRFGGLKRILKRKIYTYSYNSKQL